MKKNIKIFVLALMLCFVTAGVTYADSVYDMEYFRFSASEKTDENHPSNVLKDGAFWSTSENQKSGDYFLIDMYSVKSVGKVVLTHPEKEYPGKFRVYAGEKLENLGEPIVSAASGREGRTTVIDFPEIVQARFIKIELTAGTESAANPWAVENVSISRANSRESVIKQREAYFEKEKEKNEIYYELLSALGIDISVYDGTRSSFAAVMTRFFGLSESEDVSGALYIDVRSDTPNAEAAEAIHDILEDDIYFRPEEKITLEEALEWLLKGMGYKNYISAGGGYPKGLRATAVGLGLTDGVKSGMTSSLDEQDLPMLLYNALSAEMIVSQPIKGMDEKKESAMLHLFDVYEISGNIISNDRTSRSGLPITGENTVMIGDDVYYDEKGLSYGYVGMNVLAYVIDNDEQELLYLAPHKNTVLVIPADNAERADETSLYYRKTSDSSVSKVSFDKNPDMIYNGRGNVSFDAEKLTPDNGKLVLTDSDKNGKYDLVYVWEYINYYLGYTDNENRFFSDKYANSNITLDDETEFDIYYEGQKIDFSEIPEDSIVSVFADKTAYENGKLAVDGEKAVVYTLYVSDSVLSGICDGIIADENIAVIDGIQYRMSSDYLNAAENGKAVKLSVGKNFRLYLDYDNSIAAVEEVSSSGINYGLLLKTVFDDTDGDECKCSFRILTSTGEQTVYPLYKRVRIDGESKETDMELVKSIFWDDVESETVNPETSEIVTTVKNQLIPQIIGYTLNKNGEIISLDTKYRNEENEDKYTTLCYIPTERYTCNIYRGMIYPTDNRSKSPNLNTVNSVLFIGPADVSNADIENDYTVENRMYFVQDGKYDMEIYKKSEYNDLELAFIQSGASSDVDSYDYILVDKVSVGLTRDGDVKTKITGIQGAGYFDSFVNNEIVLEKAGLTEKGSCNLKRGDLITVETNSTGEIVSINKIFGPEKRFDPLYNNGKYYNTERITYGQVYKNKEQNIMVTSTKRVAEDGAEDNLELFMLPDTAIVYDEEADEVRKATVADIRAYSKIRNEEKTSMVYICTTWGLNTSFVIYNYE